MDESSSELFHSPTTGMTPYNNSIVPLIVHATGGWSHMTGSCGSLLTLETLKIKIKIDHDLLPLITYLYLFRILGSLGNVPAGRGGPFRRNRSLGRDRVANRVSTSKLISPSVSASEVKGFKYNVAIRIILIPCFNSISFVRASNSTVNKQPRGKSSELNKRSKKNVYTSSPALTSHHPPIIGFFTFSSYHDTTPSISEDPYMAFPLPTETTLGTSSSSPNFLFSPPSFHKFRCTMNTPKPADLLPPPQADFTPDITERGTPEPTDPRPESTPDPPVPNMPIGVPTNNGEAGQAIGNHPAPMNNLKVLTPSQVEPQPKKQQDSESLPLSSTPRHDAIKDPDTVEENSPSDDLSTVEDDDGLILDPNNEGDAELIRKRASGTSDLTGDLVQLRSHRSSESSPNDRMDRASSRVTKDNGPPETSKNTTDSAPEPTNNNDDDANEKEIIEREKLRMKELLAESDAFQEAFDKAVPSPNMSNHDSSGYDPFSTSDEGGRAGLDPNHSEQWVPSVIYPGNNLSKSKKRRRRQKKKEELLKQHDSLGKLLNGTQTKEDAERISTLDPGNSSHSGANLNESGIFGGNLLQNKRKRVQQCRDRSSFTATLNSTKFGDDFNEDDDNDDRSVLREGSPDIDINQEDLEEEKDEDLDDMEEEHPKSPILDRTNLNDSLSSNSTGAKRRRKRTKKTKTKTMTADDVPPTTEPSGPSGPKAEGRETRSKALGKHSAATDADATKNLLEHEPKGEKEKRTSATDTTNSALVLFKTPTPATRSDIQRVVSRAIHKSKMRVNNNFAIQSKIQNFRIVTNEKDVKKIPVIDELAPLVEVRIPEFIWPQEDKTQEGLVYVKTRGAIQFVILSCNCLLDRETWDTPGIEQVRDFASFLICKIAELKLEFGGVLRWTNPWGNAVVMGLDSSDLDMLLRFRTFLSTLRYGNLLFNTCPKDAMTNNFSLSILLRSDLREFREEFLAESLFARNNLFGALETLQSETFTAADTTRSGVSKNGWRNVTLEGDQTFMSSLSKFTALHWFNIGPASVQIHGGDRRAETMEEIEAKLKRRRFNLPAGQGLTSNAQAAINASFREDQQTLIQAKKQAAPNPPPSQVFAHKGNLTKNKKKK